jgi:hypothetical protein
MLGGSLPMRHFAQVFAVPVVGVPIANHDNNQHAADENLRLQNLWDGIELYAASWRTCAGERAPSILARSPPSLRRARVLLHGERDGRHGAAILGLGRHPPSTGSKLVFTA